MNDLASPAAETRVMFAWATEPTTMHPAVGERTEVLRPYEMDTTPLLRLPVTDEHPAPYAPQTLGDLDQGVTAVLLAAVPTAGDQGAPQMPTPPKPTPRADHVLAEILAEHAAEHPTVQHGRRRAKGRAPRPTWQIIALSAGAAWALNSLTVLLVLAVVR